VLGGPVAQNKANLRQRENEGKCFMYKVLGQTGCVSGLGKTNPIWSSARGVLRGTSRITPHGVTGDPTTNAAPSASNKANSAARAKPGRRSCETNLNLGKTGNLGNGASSRPITRNKANSRVRRCGRMGEAWYTPYGGWARLRKTNPIWRGLAGSRVGCTKQSQFAQGAKGELPPLALDYRPRFRYMSRWPYAGKSRQANIRKDTEMAEKLAIQGGSKAVTNKLPHWPSFDEKAIKAVEEVLRSGKVNYWTGPRGMESSSPSVLPTVRRPCTSPSAPWGSVRGTRSSCRATPSLHRAFPSSRRGRCRALPT
jgi:hypothetical protein